MSPVNTNPGAGEGAGVSETALVPATVKEQAKHYLFPVDSQASLAPRITFDYASLDHLTAKKARDAAGRIQARDASMRRDAIEIGRDLLLVKAQLDHGQFLRWLKAEFDWSERSAQNYMGAAALVTKSANVADLPITTIYKLAAPSTPDATREAIIDRLDAGERLSRREIADKIYEARRHVSMEVWKSRRRPRWKKHEKAEIEAAALKYERRAYERDQLAAQAAADLHEHLDDEVLAQFADLFQRCCSYTFKDVLLKRIGREARP